MSAIDPRIAARRRRVAEGSARNRLRTLLLALIALGLVGLGYWATQSELLDIDSITYPPSARVDVAAALASGGIGDGVTLISAVRAADDVERALEENPWVRAASVNVLFPGKVEVEIVERTAAAVIASEDGGWSLVASDHTVLDPADGPVDGLGTIADASITGPGLAFLATMGDLAAGTTIRLEGSDLWVERGGVQARLGRADQMEAKAAAFVALLGEEIAEGWAINLVAPSRPALFEVVP